jgi:hypothetical protein
LEGAAPVFQKDMGEHGAKRFVGRLRYEPITYEIPPVLSVVEAKAKAEP